MVLSGCLILLSSFPVFVWGFSSQQLVKHLLYSRHSSQVGAGDATTNRIFFLPSRRSESYWERDL